MSILWRDFTKYVVQALQMSMQEEQARQAAQEQAATSAPEPTASTPTPVTAAPTTDELEGKDVEMDSNAEAAGDDDEEMDEEEAIARAIEMSMKGEEESKK